MLSFTEELENLESKIKSQPDMAFFIFIFYIWHISHFFSSKTYSNRNFLPLEYVIRLGKQQKKKSFQFMFNKQFVKKNVLREDFKR